AFDLWAERWRRREAAGDVIIVRYADDLVVGFEHESDARRFWDAMRERLQEFSLSLTSGQDPPDRVRSPRGGQPQAARARQTAETFNFLGYVFSALMLCPGLILPPALAARHMWSELGLDDVVAELGGRGRGDGVVLKERALVLVANRLVSPSSEHGLARWLETDFVCDQRGRRWTAAWRDDLERKASRSPRVRIAADQLQ